MTEQDYFGRLEMRVCRESAGLPDRLLRTYWCDGFVPDSIAVGRRQITGDVWMARGQLGQDRWTFELVADVMPAGSREVAWAALLPPEEVTGWLSMDFRKRHMTIRPAVAYQDREPVER